MPNKARVLYVIFCEREGDVIRIVSARKATDNDFKEFKTKSHGRANKALQGRIDRGEVTLTSIFDQPVEEFEKKLSLLSDEDCAITFEFLRHIRKKRSEADPLRN